MEKKPTNHLWLSYFALPQALPGCSHLPTHPGTSNQDMLLNCQPCPPWASVLAYFILLPTAHVTLTHVHEQSWLGSFGRLGIFSQPMECGRLQGLPVQTVDVEPFAHPLSSAAIAAAIPVKIHCHRWSFPAPAAVVVLAVPTQVFLSNIPTLSLYVLLQEMVLFRALHFLVVVVLPVQFNLL